MAKSNASSHKLYIVETATPKLVADLQNVTLSFSGETIDLTTKDNGGFRDFIMGLKSFSLSGDGLVNFQTATDDRNFDDLMTHARAGSTAVLLLKNATTGDTTHQGSAKITALDLTSGTETGLAFSFSFEFIGDITVGAVS